MLKNKLLSAMGGSEPTDPNFSNTVLLLHGDGTNGAQNNTFVDSSPNNFTITRNGNVTQGTFSPFSKEPGKWGNHFANGNNDYLTIATGSGALTFGVGDFTVECWLMKTSATTGLGEFIVNGNDNSGASFYLAIHGGKISVGSTNAIPYLSGTTTVALNTWYHCAITRASGTVRIFVNGVLEASVTNTTNYSATPIVSIGSNKPLDANWPFYGYISNLRIVKGTALYTSNFTPSTAPLTAVAGTSLLCCQDNRFKDNSANNFTLTPYGNVAVTPFSPFANSAAYNPAVNGGSGYFPTSTTNGLKGSPSSAYAFGLNAFTCECWLFMERAPLAVQNIGNSSNGGQMVLFGWAYNSGDLVSWRTFFAITSSTGSSWDQAWLRSEQNDGKSSVNSILSTPLSINAWHHIAIVRPATNSPSLNVYVNGVLSCTLNITGANFTFGGTDTVQTVGWTGLTGFEYPVVGYVSSTRSVKGTALYTANFTPPTAPVTAVTNTSLLLNFTNAGIYDNTGMNNLETVGNAQISTSVKKFGTGAMYFGGSGNYLLGTNTPNMNLSGGDFTVEFWVYLNLTQSYPCIVGKNSYPGNLGWAVFIDTNNILAFYYNGLNKIYASSALQNNTWHHVAVVRSSLTVTIYINGVYSASGSASFSDSAFPFSIGGTSTSAGWDNTYILNGYIDDLRITKGVARYTANFTPPARAFPNK